MKASIVQLGDVLAIPIDDDTAAFGQVVAIYGEGAFFLAIFEGRHQRVNPRAAFDVGDVTASKVELVALTVDAKVVSRDWPRVGHVSALRTDVLPVYLVQEDGVWYVEDAAGLRKRPALASDRASLEFRAIDTPQVVEDAVQALHGVKPWNAEYDSYRPLPAHPRSGVVFRGHNHGASEPNREPPRSIKRQEIDDPSYEELVTVTLPLDDESYGSEAERRRLMQLEQRLEQAVHRAGVGELDGNEVGKGEYVLFFFGPDADTLYAVLEPHLLTVTLPRGSYAIKHHGLVSDENARGDTIHLTG